MHIFQKAIMRLPVLPVSLLQDIEKKISNNEPLDKYILDILLESIYIAAPGFYTLLIREQNEEGIFYDEKIKISLLRYLNRLCQRATPYGTMAYITALNLAQHSSAINPSEGSLEKHSRLDAQVANLLIEHLKKIPRTLMLSRLYTNNSVYTLNGKIRYIEHRVEKNIRKFKLSSMDPDEIIYEVLQFCKSGKNKKEISNYILSIEPELDVEDIHEYLDDLLENGLLLSELDLRMNDVNVLDKLSELLNSPDFATEDYVEISTLIAALKTEMQQLRDSSATAAIVHLNRIKELLIATQRLEEDSPFLQIDCFKTLDGHINKNIAYKLARVLQSMSKIHESYRGPALEAFKKEFSRRYEGRSIPLLHALDPDTGIGYPVSRNINHNKSDELLPRLGSSASEESDTLQYFFNNWSRFLLGKYKEAIANGTNEISLSIEELKPFEKNTNARLPLTHTVLCKLSTDSAESLDNGDYLLYPFDLHAPSAANVYGRFSHLNESIGQLITEIVRKEEEFYKDAICAEVEHIGQIKTANVNLKNFNRSWSLHVADAPANTNSSKYLDLDDLYLNLNEENRLILFSKKLEKEIVPYMTTAYNYGVDELPVISFLGDYQHQGNQNTLLWDWGMLRELDHLPRLVIDKNILMAPASWNIRKETLNLQSFEAFKDSLQLICKQHKIPGQVIYGDADNLLLLNLELELYLKMLFKDIKKKDALLFTEDVNNSNNQYVSDGQHSYTNELLFSYYHPHNERDSNLLQEPFLQPEKKTYLPGEEWVYLKVYFNSMNAEALILQTLNDFLPEIKEICSFQKWFYIRYEDPEPHFRLRFKFSDQKDISIAIALLNENFKALIHLGYVGKIAYDGYSPETERYGHQNMDLVEDLFQVDSEAILKLRLLLSSAHKEEKISWLSGLYNIHRYLSMIFSQEEADKKASFIKNTNAQFRKEYHLSNADFKGVNLFFEQNKAKVTEIMAGKAGLYPDIHSIFEERQWRLQDIIPGIEMTEKVIFGLIHMSMNRLFPVNPRKKEAICYDLYRSALKRKPEPVAK